MKTKSPNISKLLLPYAAIMAISCLIMQIAIAMRGSKMDFVDGLLLVPVFLYYIWFQYTSRAEVRKVRFGRLVSHLVGFIIVNLSYHIHAAALIIKNTANTSEFNVYLAPEWFGVLFGMFIFWGVGLLVHMCASIAMRGYEELEV